MCEALQKVDEAGAEESRRSSRGCEGRLGPVGLYQLGRWWLLCSERPLCTGRSAECSPCASWSCAHPVPRDRWYCRPTSQMRGDRESQRVESSSPGSSPRSLLPSTLCGAVAASGCLER